MKKMRRYCVGSGIVNLISVIVIAAALEVIYLFCLKPQGVSAADLLEFAKRIFYKYSDIKNFLVGFAVIAAVIVIAVVIRPSIRFNKCIKKFREQGILESVINDFENSIFLFDKKTKIGNKCIFYKDEGFILLLDEIKSARIKIIHTKYESGRSDDVIYYVQICFGRAYHYLAKITNDLCDARWLQLQQILRANVPHVQIESIPKTENRHIYDNHRYNNDTADDD